MQFLYFTRLEGVPRNWQLSTELVEDRQTTRNSNSNVINYPNHGEIMSKSVFSVRLQLTAQGD